MAFIISQGVRRTLASATHWAAGSASLLLPDVPEAARRTYVGRVFASMLMLVTWAQCD